MRKTNVTARQLKDLARELLEGCWNESEFEVIKTSVIYYLQEEGVAPEKLEEFDRIIDDLRLRPSFNPICGK
jgi:hypothetical protein